MLWQLGFNPDIDIFYSNKKTIKKILNLTDKDEKIKTINLDKLYRFKNGELAFIEKYLFDKTNNRYVVIINYDHNFIES